MHASTESLLSYRDGEPITADTRQHIDDCADCQAALRSIKTLQVSLGQLPQHGPPERLEPLYGKHGMKAHRTRLPSWAGGIAASLLVAAGTVLLLQEPEPQPVAEPTVRNAGTAPDAQQAASGKIRSIEQLMQRSYQLEDALHDLPARPALARARAASAEAALEHQLEVIDYGLSEAGENLTSQQQERLWRGRVALMDSLVNLRYAQFRRASL